MKLPVGLGLHQPDVRVKLKGVHALRHAAGTRLREKTGDLALVADHLRHGSLDTARSYAKADNRGLRRALGER